MKKINNIIIIGSILGIFILPLNTHAKTLSEFEAEVSKYTAELQEKENKIARNDAEVAKITQHISEIQQQMRQAEDDIDNLTKEIDESNKKIKKKDKESKKIIEYYQVSNGENAYLEYIFGAKTIKDMIYRISMAEQLTEYNDKVMDELETLIKKNKEKQKQLASKKEELNSLQKELDSERERINADSQAVRDTMPSVQEQIKAAKENVAYLKRIGCGSNEDVESCIYRVNQSSASVSVPSSGSVLRPTTVGVKQGGLYSYAGHLGQDLTSPNKKNETIYPIANGYVLAVYSDACYGFCRYTCNGNANIIAIRHNINGRYIYATYVHLSQVYVGAGQQVSAYTPIGKMGNTGCTSGSDEGRTSIHLHIELSTCHWKPGGGCSSYTSYTSRIINPSSYISFPQTWFNR